MRSRPQTDLSQTRRQEARIIWPPHRRQLSRHLLKSSLLARDRRIRFARHVPDSERRIAVWSSSPADQTLLEETPLAHVVPDDPAPYAEVVINNLGGNKLDYYLKSEIEYAADGCDGEKRMSTVTVRLTNTLQDAQQIPNYVGAPNGQPLGIRTMVPNGTMVSSVRLLATRGATLVSALADGHRVPVFPATERGHPSFEVQVAIPPGQSGELSFHLSEPTAPGAPSVPIQPLVDNVTPKVSVPECSG